VSLGWYGVMVPCWLLAVDVLFWRAAFMPDEVISLPLLVIATGGGPLTWGWSLHNAWVRGWKTPKERGLT
jgi:hypothetical protein